MQQFMNFLEFTSCKADPDLWMRKATKEDRSFYWEYVLLYTDYILVVSDQGEIVLRSEIGEHFKLKESLVGAPDI